MRCVETRESVFRLWCFSEYTTVFWENGNMEYSVLIARYALWRCARSVKPGEREFPFQRVCTTSASSRQDPRAVHSSSITTTLPSATVITATNTPSRTRPARFRQ